MFEWLFKYPLEAFTEGTLILALPPWQLALMPLAIFVLAYVSLGYFYIRRRTPLRHRLLTTGLRSLALALVIFSMTRPLLEVTSSMPQPSIVGVLLDNSLSMTVPDQNGSARSDFIREQFATDGDLLRELQTRFDTKLFRFGATTAPIASVDELDFSDGASNLDQALRSVANLLRGEPLAGLVVVGDGASADNEQLTETLKTLRAASVPVHGIGLGAETLPRDLELGPVRLPPRVLAGSRVVAEVQVRQQGYSGETIELIVEDDSRILHKQTLELVQDEQLLQLPLRIEDSGARELRFHITRFEDEQIPANNSRFVRPTVLSEPLRVLYFEGEPRFEMKFVRRAVAGDAGLRISGLIRTADAKFYRVGVDSEDELRNGFPITREELFAYDALILGSVEISLLSREQQQMIVDFVSRRGGGLLLLGGRHAFAEGGYADSVIRDVAPVIMADEARPDFKRQVKIQPSTAAWVHPALMLADDLEASIARWQTLPPLTIVNPINEVKPGAALLLSGPGGDGSSYVALAAQRYGRGRVIAFPVQNSWLWQMHHEIELEDQTHELLWRQLLRWLAEDVPPQVSLNLEQNETHVGGRIKLSSEVHDSGFDSIDNAEARAILTLPDGSEQVQPLTRHASLPGTYELELTAEQAGDHRVRIELDTNGNTISSGERRFRASTDGAEFYAAGLNTALLGQVAAATGGSVFSADDADDVTNLLDRQQRETSVLARHELWDMPIIFLLLMALLCGEWAYRRWRNLV